MLAYPLALLYVFEWLGYQELTLPIKRENRAGLHAVRRPPGLYPASPSGMLVAIMVLTLAHRTVAVRHARCWRSSRTRRRPRPRASTPYALEAQGARSRSAARSPAWSAAFYAVVLLVVTPPSVFGMLVSAQALTVTMFGGIGTVWGRGDRLGDPDPGRRDTPCRARLAKFPGIQGVIFGLGRSSAIILVAPEGIYWKAARRLAAPAAGRSGRPGPRRRRRCPGLAVGRGRARSPRNSRRRACRPIVILERSRPLARTFGGLKAVQDVSFDVPQGRDRRNHRSERRGQDDRSSTC